ncbi:uncharacterized protein LOC131265790 isoform X2 [Anopheles coustani]|uniref:uncharacterized protein LOC131265790 isoform X2 n=1 Tax=Anopheles coustani TaxID=139045 RepID=UPI002657FC0B|nr:uncharacterized protein LOC131265790 isoform X2 [Anopheles coustani]
MSRPTAGSSKTSKTQADIRDVMAQIQQRVQRQPVRNSALANDQTTRIPAEPPPQIAIADHATVNDAFAKQIFFQHTNIEQIVLDKMAERSERTRQKYQQILYERYVQNPLGRLSDPLHMLRFETPFWEGLFSMATKIPIPTEAAYQTMVSSLAKDGVKKMSFVDMTRNNLVLEDQREVIQLLQSKFSNWSGKLLKLKKYLKGCQQGRERNAAKEKEKLLRLIVKRSNYKKQWHRFLDRIIYELRGPVEKRTLFIWHKFAFDDDALNRKYNVGLHYADPEGRSQLQRISTGPSLGHQILSHTATGIERAELRTPTPLQASVSRHDNFLTPRPLTQAPKTVPVSAVQRDTAAISPTAQGSIAQVRTAPPSTAQGLVSQVPTVPISTSQGPITQGPIAQAPNAQVPTAALNNSQYSSVIPEIQQEHEDDQNINTTNRSTEQPANADRSISNAAAEQEPPTKRARTADHLFAVPLPIGAVCKQEKSSSAHHNSTISLISPAQPITTTTDTPEFSLDYIKSSTNIYEVLIYNRMKKFPKTKLTSRKVDKLVKAFYEFYKSTFDRQELPAALRELTPQEQLELKSKGACRWASEKLHIPIVMEQQGVEQPATVTASTTSAVVAVPDAVQPLAHQPVPSKPDVNTVVPTKESREKAPQPKKKLLFPRPCPIRPANINYESDTASTSEKNVARPNSQPTANQMQQNTPNMDMLSDPDTMSFMPPVCSTQNQDGGSQPPEPHAPSQEQNERAALESPRNEDMPSQPPDNAVGMVFKLEPNSSQVDSSGYEGYVEEIPCANEVLLIYDTDEMFLEDLETPEQNALQNRLVGLFRTESDTVAPELTPLFSHIEDTGVLENGETDSYASP